MDETFEFNPSIEKWYSRYFFRTRIPRELELFIEETSKTAKDEIEIEKKVREFLEEKGITREYLIRYFRGLWYIILNDLVSTISNEIIARWKLWKAREKPEEVIISPEEIPEKFVISGWVKWEQKKDRVMYLGGGLNKIEGIMNLDATKLTSIPRFAGVMLLFNEWHHPEEIYFGELDHLGVRILPKTVKVRIPPSKVQEITRRKKVEFINGEWYVVETRNFYQVTLPIGEMLFITIYRFKLDKYPFKYVSVFKTKDEVFMEYWSAEGHIPP